MTWSWVISVRPAPASMPTSLLPYSSDMAARSSRVCAGESSFTAMVSLASSYQ
ncbi:Uncharacterised protein [Mycobacteroides abscessus]|nr:Uncharacterised protein [Mycobacteroides abscessus]